MDVLADLHAGRYPQAVAGPLRQRIAGDPGATSVLAALDATVDDLSLLPTPRMPERFALRLDAAIAAEYRAATSAGAVPGGEPAARSTTDSGPAVDGGVPQPRQAVNQSLSTSEARRSQNAGGQTAPPRRSPPSAGPPLPGLHGALSPQAPAQPARRAVPPPTALPPHTAARPGQQAGPEPSPAPPSATGVPATDRPANSRPTSFAGSTTATIHSLRAARSKRRRWVGGLVAAAAAIAIGTATVASLDHSGDTGGSAAEPASAPAAPDPATGGNNALQLDPGRFGDALKQIEGKRPAGSLQDSATYSRCLAANAIDPSAVRGVTAVTFDGKPAAAIAVVIDAGHSKVVVVGPDCGISGAADQLAAQTVNR